MSILDTTNTGNEIEAQRRGSTSRDGGFYIAIAILQSAKLLCRTLIALHNNRQDIILTVDAEDI